jgi:hypothetical protein
MGLIDSLLLLKIIILLFLLLYASILHFLKKLLVF